MTGAFFSVQGLGRFAVDYTAQEWGKWRRSYSRPDRPSKYEPPKLPIVLAPGAHWLATIPARGACEALEERFEYRAIREGEVLGPRRTKPGPMPKVWKTVFEIDLPSETLRLRFSIEMPQMHVWPWEY